MIQAERTLQAEIMARLNTGRWPLIALPIPNGLWIPARSDTEKHLVCRLIARMKADGLLVPGAPDLCLFWRDGAALVELKRPRSRDLFGKVTAAGRPSAAQSAIAARAAKLGINHAVVHDWPELQQRLEGWGIA